MWCVVLSLFDIKKNHTTTKTDTKLNIGLIVACTGANSNSTTNHTRAAVGNNVRVPSAHGNIAATLDLGDNKPYNIVKIVTTIDNNNIILV